MLCGISCFMRGQLVYCVNGSIKKKMIVQQMMVKIGYPQLLAGASLCVFS